MSITSVNFILFALVTLRVYHVLPHKYQNIWLLCISYAFVITWSWQFAIVLGLVTIVNFLIALKLRKKDQVRRDLLWIGIAFNIFLLVFFRAANFFLPQLQLFLERLGVSTKAVGLQILIPLGLSFYILQTISYLIDIYRGQINAEKNWVNFALYLAYFPKITAGPIERARSFLPKLAQSRVVDSSVIARSIVLILVGAARKLLIADWLTAIILLDVFEFPAKYTPPELIGWMVIYSFALYNDFAGYTNIARGISGLFGIELSVNFRTPYFSRTFTEFWNRWHITLSEWLRDYIYFPLSRLMSRRNPNRRDLPNLVVPPLMTMLISGLWHGLSWHMLLWGFLHGIYQVVDRILITWRPHKTSQDQALWKKVLAMGGVCILVAFAWIPFRWGLPATLDFWRALLDWSNTAIRYSRLFIALPILLVSLFMDLLEYRNQDEFVYLKWPRFAQAACMAVLLLLLFIVTGGDFQEPFVYQAF
jgi:D-alanyl-lipoteichoic acid acyltransferase DltB (MBOAT superfamily)